MLLKKGLGVDRKVKVFVSTVEKKVTLLKMAIVQLVDASVVSVANTDTMLTVARGEGSRSLGSQIPLHDGEEDIKVKEKEVRLIL